MKTLIDSLGNIAVHILYMQEELRRVCDSERNVYPRRLTFNVDEYTNAMRATLSIGDNEWTLECFNCDWRDESWRAFYSVRGRRVGSAERHGQRCYGILTDAIEDSEKATVEE